MAIAPDPRREYVLDESSYENALHPVTPPISSATVAIRSYWVGLTNRAWSSRNRWCPTRSLHRHGKSLPYHLVAAPRCRGYMLDHCRLLALALHSAIPGAQATLHCLCPANRMSQSVHHSASWTIAGPQERLKPDKRARARRSLGRWQCAPIRIASLEVDHHDVQQLPLCRRSVRHRRHDSVLLICTDAGLQRSRFQRARRSLTVTLVGGFVSPSVFGMFH